MASENPETNVFLTVDTEHSIGGAFNNPLLKPVSSDKRIFGRIGKRYFGIPLMMDIADRYGLKMIFFLEVLNKYWFGEEESRRVCDYILKRNHEVQLHIHPNYLNFTNEHPGQLEYSDFMSDYSIDRQIELLSEARELLVKYGAPSPTAFRAGCFGAGVSTLKALGETGFLIDSSFNRAYCNVTCSIPESDTNDLRQMEEVWELPVTNFIENSHVRHRRFMPMDINGVSFEEMKQVLEHSILNGPNNLTIILHSFSFIKAFDVQYNKVKPRYLSIKRFEKLCCFLAENKKFFNVSTFKTLTRQNLFAHQKSSRHYYYKMPSFYSLCRGCEQVADRFI